MFYAKIESGQATVFPISERELRARVNASLPPTITPECLEGLPYVQVEPFPPEDFPKPTSEKRVEVAVYQDTDGKWKRNYTLVDVAEDVKYSRIAKQIKKVRAKRDALMNAFDWRIARYNREVALGKTPTDNIDELHTYMQALADITKQGDPFLVEFPTEPGPAQT